MSASLSRSAVSGDDDDDEMFI
ncbi:hypothetical protein A2U01_0117526, partial [Trifolium medium]|nr:hypothetical protein [Trifolium medium]